MLTKLFSALLLANKRDSVTDTGFFEAIASTYGPPADEVGDVIKRGAFDSALALHQQRGTMPAMLWNHDSGEPVGKWLDFADQGDNLVLRGQLTMGIRRGREARALLNDGALAFSIGFAIGPNDTERQGDIRIIKTVSRLYEVSLVSIPANPRAQLKPTNVKEFERALRDVGLSVREAKRVTVGGWYGFARSERTENELLLEGMNDLRERLATIQHTIEAKNYEH